MTTPQQRINEVRAAALAVLRPPDKRPLSAWMEERFHLPGGLSDSPGLVRLWPFQRALCDALADPAVERVTVLKGARLGYSTLLLGAIAHFAARDPCNVLAVLPTEDDCKSFVTSQLEPSLTASPHLRATLAIDRSAEGRDRLLFRQFPGGSLRVVAARSPRNLRAHSARVVVMDECDAFEPTAEGNPILLAERRSMSFRNRKIIIGSTPTTSTTSHVHAAYERSDQRVYECRCPSCGEFAEVRWKDIKWPDGKPAEAAWCCPSCGVLHGEAHKPAMVREGRWTVTRPDVMGHAGFRLSCLIAPHPAAAWSALAAEFLDAKKRPEDLRTFVNTVLAELWDDGDTEGAIDPSGLLPMAAPISLQRIPSSVLYLCSGADVQGDRIEITTMGFDAEDHWLVLDHRILPGHPLQDAVWHDLADHLRETYRREDGATIGRSMTAVDAGDGNTQARVEMFCRMQPACVAIKGVPGARPLVTRSESKRIRLWLVGVDTAKQRLHDRMTRAVGFTFKAELPEEWRLQMTSERRVIRYQRGQPVAMWQRIPGRMAEALDAAVYALAARALVNTPPSRRADELRGHAPPPALPRVIRSRWLAKSDSV